MRENVFDIVVDRLLARRDSIRAKLAKQYKRVKPFRMQEIPKQELSDAYTSLTYTDMQELIQKYGEEKVNQFISEMELLKDKEVLNAYRRNFRGD